MTDPDLETLVHEAYATHTILANLGFEPGNITIVVTNVINAERPGLHACVRLDEGGKSFVMFLAPVKRKDGKRFLKAMQRFSEQKKGLSTERLDAIVKGSQVWRRADEMLWALQRKGFEVRVGYMSN